MAWTIYVAHFFAGVFLINALPHLINGLSGRKFPSPFGKPPGRGESSPRTNVFWGFANLVVGYALLMGVGTFAFNLSLDALVLAVGGLLMAWRLSTHFGQVYSA